LSRCRDVDCLTTRIRQLLLFPLNRTAPGTFI
jgi:hypothetical protein